MLISAGYVSETCEYSPGALGCALSHIRLWEQAALSEGYTTIFEDDAFVSKEFSSRSAQILFSLPKDWDIILWGLSVKPPFAWIDIGTVRARLEGYGEKRAIDEDSQAFLLQLDPTSAVRLAHGFGLFGYSISSRGARSALAHVLPLRKRWVEFADAGVRTSDIHIDVSLCDLYPRLNAYVCLPPLVVHDDHTASDRKARA